MLWLGSVPLPNEVDYDKLGRVMHPGKRVRGLSQGKKGPGTRAVFEALKVLGHLEICFYIIKY